jgi:CheY-like chemotaxis protein/anti-sigma regulatory factor (Ser/Thr protein kinase)
METIIRDAAGAIQPQCAQKGLHLVVEVESNIGLTLGDEDRLKQVVVNLASNACHRTAKGGDITLTLSRSGGAVRVDVADTGVAIPPEDQAKIFQRFYRLDAPSVSDVKDTGLGLPIAKMLLEMHGGRLWVESEPEKGSIFTFILPLFADATGEEIEHPETKRTILVVEDDYDLAQLIALQLQEEGYKVLTTELGEEAVQLARTRDIDLITLDIMLPDITGIDVLRLLKADSETADIPVIVVSVLQPDDAEDGSDVADHITKPFALERLTTSVRRALGYS